MQDLRHGTDSLSDRNIVQEIIYSETLPGMSNFEIIFNLTSKIREVGITGNELCEIKWQEYFKMGSLELVAQLVRTLTLYSAGFHPLRFLFLRVAP